MTLGRKDINEGLAEIPRRIPIYVNRDRIDLEFDSRFPAREESWTETHGGGGQVGVSFIVSMSGGVNKTVSVTTKPDFASPWVRLALIEWHDEVRDDRAVFTDPTAAGIHDLIRLERPGWFSVKGKEAARAKTRRGAAPIADWTDQELTEVDHRRSLEEEEGGVRNVWLAAGRPRCAAILDPTFVTPNYTSWFRADFVLAKREPDPGDATTFVSPLAMWVTEETPPSHPPLPGDLD